MFSQSMFSCRACVPRDRDADTVRVTVADIEAREARAAPAGRVWLREGAKRARVLARARAPRQEES